MKSRFGTLLIKIFKSIQRKNHYAVNDSDNNRLIKTISDYKGLYDGDEHGIILNVEDGCKVEYSLDSINWGSYEPKFKNIGKEKVYVRVSYQKKVEESAAFVEITQRNVILSSNSAIKEYDGIPLTEPKIEITGDGVLEGDIATLFTNSSQLTVGKCRNTINYTFLNKDVEKNYSITLNEGILEIIDRNDKYKVEIIGKSAEYLYDGIEHRVSGFENLVFNVEERKYQVKGIYSNAFLKHAGNVETVITGQSIVYDQEGNDVSNQFQIKLKPGILNIKPRTVLLKSASDRKEYDGIKLANTIVEINGDGFCKGEKPSFIMTGSQTIVGRSENNFTYVFPAGVVEEDYHIILEYGVLEVFDRIEKPIIILHLSSGEYLYDASDHVVAGIMEKYFEVGGIRFFIEIEDYPVHATNAGIYYHDRFASISVYDSLHNNVTNQFELHVRPGVLKINKRELILESASARKEYDGEALTERGILIFGDDLVNGDQLEVKTTGSQVLVGKSRNHISYCFSEDTNSENYNVTLREGVLVVSERHSKIKITLKANSAEFLYDGELHKVEGFENPNFTINDLSYSITGVYAGASLLHVGWARTLITGTPVVLDVAGNNVSNQFDIQIQYGKISIKSREVLIVSSSAVREYNGSYLENKEIEILGDGFVEGEEPNITVYGKQKIVGISNNSFSFEFSPKVRKQDYYVTLKYGTLEILDRKNRYPVDVYLNSSEYDYDTNEHRAEGISEECKTIVMEGNRYYLTVIDKAVVETQIGEYLHNEIDSYLIKDEDGNDVTNQFEIIIHEGKLIIKEPEKNISEEEIIDEYDIAIHDILVRMSGENIPESDEKIKKYTRKELEALYEDKKEVILGKEVIDPFLLFEWGRNNALARLHNRVVKQLPELVLLSEIEIDDKEYEILLNNARQSLKKAQLGSDYIFADILFTLAIIQIGIRNYSHGFWGQAETELRINIDMAEKRWIGNTVTTTLQKLGKPIYSETEYVQNILMHCFVTDPYASRFFDYLFSFYRIDLERDVSGLQRTDTDYICDSIINPYSKRQHLLSDYMAMSIRADRDYCREVIEKALYMIDSLFWDEDISEQNFLTGRLLKRFYEWSEQSVLYRTEKQKNEQKAFGAKERLYRTPHLIFDPYKESFVVILPPQMIPVRDESKRPSVKWFVVSNGEKEFNCELKEGYSGYKTNEIKYVISTEKAFCKTAFLLFSDNSLVRSFTWTSHEAAFFTENWNWIRGSKLEPGKTYGFCLKDSRITTNNVLFEGQFKDLRYYELGLSEGDFVLVQGEDNYYVGKVPSPGLDEQYKVKGVEAEFENASGVPVYSKDPQIVVEVEEGKLQGIAIFANGQINRLSELDFVDVHVGHTTDRKYYFVSAANIKGIREGYNTIFVDYPNSLKRLHVEFYKATDFGYNFIGVPYVFGKSGIVEILGEYYEVLKFDMDELDNGRFSLRLNDNTVIRISVPMLLYSWDKETWFYQKRAEFWHADLPNVLYIRYPAKTIELFVDGSKKELSRTSFRVLSDGVFNCDLTKLKSYFSKKKMLDFIGMESEQVTVNIISILQRSFLQDAKLLQEKAINGIKAEMKILGKNMYYADLFCEDTCVAEKEPVEDGVVLFRDIEIETADYTIKIYEEEDEFGFDEDYEYVGEKTFPIINFKDLMGSRMKVTDIRIGEKNKLRFHREYDYYIFPEEQIVEGEYRGILSSVFHKQKVTYASNVKIKINDLNNPNEIEVIKTNSKGNLEYFAFDKEKRAVVDYENKFAGNSRYIYLNHEKNEWIVEFIGSNNRLLNESKEWIKTRDYYKNKPFSIWKN